MEKKNPEKKNKQVKPAVKHVPETVPGTLVPADPEEPIVEMDETDILPVPEEDLLETPPYVAPEPGEGP